MRGTIPLLLDMLLCVLGDGRGGGGQEDTYLPVVTHTRTWFDDLSSDGGNGG